LRHGALLLAWLSLVGRTFGRPERNVVVSFSAAAVGMGIVGLLLGVWSDWAPVQAAAWLRFYWFRLCDMALPAGTALLAVVWCREIPARVARRVSLWMAVAAMAVVASAGDYAWLGTSPPESRADKGDRISHRDDWLDVCQWVRDNTPTDALFVTPRSSQTFKWHAERSEIGTWKDVPQDAQTMVQWWRRMQSLHGTGLPKPAPPSYDSLAEVPHDRLLRLSRAYGASYIVTEALPSLPWSRRYSNGSYAVYQLPGDAGIEAQRAP
jgi:hypothetical protein